MQKRIGLTAGILLMTAGTAAAGPDNNAHTPAVDARSLPQPQLTEKAPSQLVAGKETPRVKRPYPRAPDNAPNVVLVMLDDVGFGAPSTFGGPIPTPHLSQLADQGLKYNRFHNAGVCSPSRASLLTGRNSHAVGVGSVLNSSRGEPGRTGILTDKAATIAQVLRMHGYSTSAWGKWHLMPRWEASPIGPFDRWPTHQGFDHFYGFLGARMNQLQPVLYNDTTLVTPDFDKDYTMNRDLADRAIDWIHLQKSIAPERPFFAYFSPGATHAPLQVSRKWINQFQGDFKQGWDEIRKQIIARQKKLGVIPADTKLTGRPDGMPAWDSLSPDEQKVATRLMQTYAGFLAQTDAQVGRLSEALKQMGEFDNTLFIYVVGDNGGAPDSGPRGTLNTNGSVQGIRMSPAQALKHIDDIGGRKSYAGYPVGWAWAMGTPFKWTKEVASYFGGTRSPLVISWPGHVKNTDVVRDQFAYIDDIFPTILEAAGIQAPARVDGVPQLPVDGTSLVYTFADAHAKGRHHTQYFEVFGNRAIYHDGWIASAFHRQLPWHLLRPKPRKFKNDQWELYNLKKDYSQSNDLADQQPEKLREMKNRFWAVAALNNVLPLDDHHRPRLPARLAGKNGHYTYGPAAVGIPGEVAPPIFNRGYTITAKVKTPENGGHGVIVAEGGTTGGWSIYLDDAGKPVYIQNLFDVDQLKITGNKPLPAGRHTLVFKFEPDAKGFGKGGTGRLSVDGKAVGHGHINATPSAFFELTETFDLGIDLGSPVGDYPAYYRFTGKVDKVSVKLE